MKELPITEGTITATQMCRSCPFGNEPIALTADRLQAIQTYLIQGTNHFCHSDPDNKTICRGGRNFQLNIWHRLGMIAEPTDEALHAAMAAAGVQPKVHLKKRRPSK